MSNNQVSIYKCTGKGYENGWWTNCHCRYRCFKGARNTKKSYNIIGLEVLNKIMTDKNRNVLIIRETNNTQRMSTFSTLCMLIDRPDLLNDEISFNSYFKINQTDMTITYKPTGQVILFRGFDDPQKLQSIRVPKGFLTDVYIEEAFELDDYEEWRKFDGSIRGKLPNGVFHQITFCFNAWNKDHWIYEHFFKDRLEDDVEYLSSHTYEDWCDPNLIIDYGRGLYLHTSTYKINEFRDKDIYDIAMEQLRLKSPAIWLVEALGCWGNASEQVYLEWNDNLIRTPQEINKMNYYGYAIGIDTGLSNGQGKVNTTGRYKSATTMQMVGLTQDFGKICCIDEFFYSNEAQLEKRTEPQLMEDIIDKIIEWKETYMYHPVLMQGTIPVYVDCADIGFRQGLELVARKKGLFNVIFQGSTKISIQTRVDFIRLLMAWGEYLVSSKCSNLIREIKNCRKGEKQVREDFDDHSINANEYAWQPLIVRLRRWKTFKQR